MLDRLLEWLTAPLPRFVRVFVLPTTALALVAVFVFLGFPYDVVADRALDAVEARTGAVVRYGQLEPRLTIGGPGFRLHEVDVRLADGRRFRLDPLSVRPAWSTSWLSGSPQIRAFLLSDHGSLAGFVTLGRSYAWDGRIVDFDLALLPLPADGIRVSGRADVEADVRIVDGAAEGRVDLEARGGDLLHPMIPMPIEFDTIDGSVRLGGEYLAQIDSLALQGPLFAGSAKGTVGRAKRPGTEPLELAIGIDIREPGMRSMARNFGLALDANGHADLRLRGTASNPELD